MFNLCSSEPLSSQDRCWGVAWLGIISIAMKKHPISTDDIVQEGKQDVADNYEMPQGVISTCIFAVRHTQSYQKWAVWQPSAAKEML